MICQQIKSKDQRFVITWAPLLLPELFQQARWWHQQYPRKGEYFEQSGNTLKANKTDLKFFENIIKTPAPDPWRPAQLNWWQVRQFSKVATFIHLKIFFMKENICTQVNLKCYQLLWCERQLLVQRVGEHQSRRFRGKQVHDDQIARFCYFFISRTLCFPVIRIVHALRSYSSLTWLFHCSTLRG